MKRKVASKPEAAATPERRIELLKISEIARRPQFQVRKHGTYSETVREYADKMQAGVEFPPVKVADIKGVLTLVDGWHRCEAHERIGRREVEAEIIEATETEARWMAAIANAAHGVPLTRSDYLNVFHAYVKARKHRTPEGGFKSYREIARELGGTRRHTTISLWMHKHYPAVARQMQKEPVEGPREEEPIDRDEAGQRRLVEEIQAVSSDIRNCPLCVTKN